MSYSCKSGGERERWRERQRQRGRQERETGREAGKGRIRLSGCLTVHPLAQRGLLRGGDGSTMASVTPAGERWLSGCLGAAGDAKLSMWTLFCLLKAQSLFLEVTG